MTDHALVFEHDVLPIRVSQFFERIGNQIRQIIHDRNIHEDNSFICNACLLANQLFVFYKGTIVRFVRLICNGLPTADVDRKWSLLYWLGNLIEGVVHSGV